jgi:hypothetical protein
MPPPVSLYAANLCGSDVATWHNVMPPQEWAVIYQPCRRVLGKFEVSQMYGPPRECKGKVGGEEESA